MYAWVILIALFVSILINGYAFATILHIKRYPIASSYSLGIGFIALCLFLAGQFAFTWEYTAYLYIGISAICILFAIGISLMQRSQPKQIPLSPQAVFAFIFVILGYSVYYFLVGPYDLVPSDTLRHLERIQFALKDLQKIAPSTFYIDGLNENYIYYLYAVFWHFMQTDIDAFFYQISYVTAIVFLSSLFWFVYHASKAHTSYGVSLSLLTCVFFILHQGFAGFVYIKYYALSAALWCMPLYFLGVLLVRDIFSYRHGFTAIYTLALLVLICALYHIQEALFIIVMAIALWIYYVIISFATDRQFKNAKSRLLRAELLLYGLLALLLYVIVYYVWIRHIPATPVDHFKVIDVSNFFGFASRFYALNPFFQFNQIATHFGALVLLLALLTLRQQMRIPILFAGLLIPVLTVFNPLFIDLFLRFRDVHVVYRFLYIVPFAMLAAFFLIETYVRYKQGKLWFAAIRAVACALIIVCLFPLTFISDDFRYSRFAGLQSVPKDQSLRHLNDVAKFVEDNNRSRWILTDSLTGYVLTATTSSVSSRYKFIPNRNAIVSRENVSAADFRVYHDALLVVNLRDGGYSHMGVLSTHWPADVLKTSAAYSPQFLRFVDDNPQMFEPLWQQDKVSVYRISVR